MLKFMLDTNIVIKDIVESDLNEDPFTQFPELVGFDIYAGDGHYYSAAAHDVRLESILCNGLNGSTVRGYILSAGRKRTWTC